MYHDSLEIINSTFTENTANTIGGGITTAGGSVITIHNSIVAGNSSPSDADASGSFDASSSYNLVGEAGGSALSPGQNGNITGDPMLSPLGDYGGPTKTHALQFGSLALNSGDNAIAIGLTGDQRGNQFERILDSTVDIGAIEAHVIDDGSGNITIHGTGANDLITVDNISVSIDTLGGNPIAVDIANAASVTVLAGDGNDTVSVDSQVTRGMTLQGGLGDDSLSGGAGDDDLRGGSGSDTLEAGSGTNVLDGGIGADTYQFDNSIASVNIINDSEAVNDTLDFSNWSIFNRLNSIDLAFVGLQAIDENFQIQVDLQSSIYQVIGTIYSENIYGDDNGNVLIGNGGGDYLYGRGGDDFLEGGDYFDNISGGDGNDKIYGYGADDTLLGDAGDDIIDGGDGNDSLTGGSGDDWYLFSGTGNLGTDTIFESIGEGTDTLDFSGLDQQIDLDLSSTATTEIVATDRLWLAALSGVDLENVIGTDYDDTITGNGLPNTVTGGAGADNLSGGAGDDVLLGGTGDDSVSGGDGNDSISGGAGSDQFDGGSGTDDFEEDGDDPLHAPQIDSIGSQQTRVDLSFATRIVADDVEDSYANLLFSATVSGGSLPVPQAVDTTGGVLRWIPPNDGAGSYTFDVTVTDTDGMSDSTSFSLTVDDYNESPPTGFGFGLFPTQDITRDSPTSEELAQGLGELYATHTNLLTGDTFTDPTGPLPPASDDYFVDTQTWDSNITFTALDPLPPGASLNGHYVDWDMQPDLGGQSWLVRIKATDNGDPSGTPRSSIHDFHFSTKAQWYEGTAPNVTDHGEYGAIASNDFYGTSLNSPVSEQVIDDDSFGGVNLGWGGAPGEWYHNVTISHTNPTHASSFSFDSSTQSTMGSFTYNPETDGEGIDTFTYSHSVNDFVYEEQGSPPCEEEDSCTNLHGTASNTATVTIEVGKAVRADIDIDLPEFNPDAAQTRSSWHTYDPAADAGDDDLAIIKINDDDDNENLQEDRFELSNSGEHGENQELVKVRLGYWLRDDAQIDDFVAKLQVSTLGDTLLHVWDTKEKDNEIIPFTSLNSGTEFKLTDLPEEVWMEGINSGFVSLSLVISGPATALFTDITQPRNGSAASTSDSDTVQLAVMSADLDISHVTTGIVPDHLEENPGGLVAVLEDDTDRLLKQPEDWSQPHTRFLVSPPEITLPTGGFLTLDFPGNLVVWEVLPDNSERQIISEVTQIAADRDSLFYAYGTEKSGAERDTEVELTLNNVAPQPTVLDKVKVTIVNAFYELNMTTFIPFDAFYDPVGTLTGGDNRGFDHYSNDFRTRQLVIMTPFEEFDIDGIVAYKDDTGWSVSYDAPTSLLNYDPNETDPNNLTLKQIAKDEEQIEANKGIPYKIDWAKASGDTLGFTNLNFQTNNRQVSATFFGNENNPLFAGSPGISYQFRITIDASLGGTILAPELDFFYSHDGFPAYEIYVDGMALYTHDPRQTGDTVWSLFPPEEYAGTIKTTLDC